MVVEGLDKQDSEELLVVDPEDRDEKLINDDEDVDIEEPEYGNGKEPSRSWLRTQLLELAELNVATDDGAMLIDVISSTLSRVRLNHSP